MKDKKKQFTLGHPLKILCFPDHAEPEPSF